MHRVMRKPHGLQVRRYSDCMIDPNEYLAVFYGAKANELFCETGFNEKLNTMHNSCIRQAYMQGFYCESIT